MKVTAVWVCVMALAALCACKPAAPAPAPAPDVENLSTVGPDMQVAPEMDVEPVMYADGFGPLKIGMTRDEVIAAAGAPTIEANPAVPATECDMFTPAELPDVKVMIENGVLTRVTASRAPLVSTDTGIIYGDDATKVKEVYAGRFTTSPHKYAAAPAEDIVIWEVGDGKDAASRGLRFEIDALGSVDAMHSGGPSILYVEGCS